MATELDQVVQAIVIASDPAQVALHQQALGYLSNVQQNAEAWRLALAIFVETSDDGARKHPAVVRFYALRMLDEFLDNRYGSWPYYMTPLNAHAVPQIRISR
jgi:exportin-T